MKKLSMIVTLLLSMAGAGEVQARTRAPNAKQLLTKLMQHESSNFKQLMASEHAFLHNNPLLQGMDRLAQITPQDIDDALGITRRLVSTRLGAIASVQDISFDALYTPLEEIDVYLEKIWKPIILAANLVNTDNEKLVQAYHDVRNNYLPWIKQQVLLDETVFQKLLALKESEVLTAEQRRVVEVKLEQMQHAGIMLSEEARVEAHIIHKIIADLIKELRDVYITMNKKTVLLLTQKEEVAGLPEVFLQWAAKSYAARNDEASSSATEGPWLIELILYKQFMTYSTRRDLRASFHHSLITMTKESRYEELLRDILRLRKKLANIFGVENYTDYSMSKRLIKDSSEIEVLMDDLNQAILPYTKRGYESLAAYAHANGHEGEIKPYDVYFWKQKLVEEQISKISPKLPKLFDNEKKNTHVLIEDTMQGVFTLAYKLFGIKIKKHTEQKTWHPDVSFYRVYDESGDHIGSFYLDPYRRAGKRGHAWVLPIRARGACEIAQNVPVCYMATNFKPPDENKTALLTYQDVKIFLHEFGHVLQHMLMKNNYHTLARVPNLDMVEFSSKFMERFLSVESLLSDIFPQHMADFVKQIIRSINAGENVSLSSANLQKKMLEDMFFIQADMEIHRNYDPDGEESPADFLRRIANKTRILPASPRDEFSSEIFRIMTSSSYDNPFFYIYKLGEVMASDVFALFEENGLEDEQLRVMGQLLWDKFMAAGGSKSTLELLKELRGRPLTAEAYLQRVEKRELFVD